MDARWGDELYARNYSIIGAKTRESLTMRGAVLVKGFYRALPLAASSERTGDTGIYDAAG
ncbi:MAG TPA: hypothetical protein VG537_00340 [Candidatus Kapabacteria bacterium]|nr:hypothetical protein [Candidatus Kapabacteria bacterium]